RSEAAPCSEVSPRLTGVPRPTDAPRSNGEGDFVPWTTADLYRLGLAGEEGARALRAKVGKALGIGYAATNRFLFRLNQYRISREAVARELQERE
ncbi:MAG: DUF4093 domain-containing protein, partial [Bacillota bacterium]|nr:DUF4093 domain-containing protein [Bacillota bacterium]